MGCECKGQRIHAAVDQRFESEVTGEAAIHWLDISTWEALGGARAILSYLTVLGMEGTTPRVEIVARGSADGKTWATIAGLASVAITAASATPVRNMLVPTAVTPLPLLVQFGLKVYDTSLTDQAAVRVTWSLEPRHGTGTPALGKFDSMVNPTVSQDLTGILDLLGELDVSFSGKTSAAAAVFLDLETSPDMNIWFRAATIALTTAGESDSARANDLMRYARLVNRSAVTTTLDWSFKAMVP